MKGLFASLAASAVLLGSPALAVELHHIVVRTGTDGLVAAPLSVTNTGATPLSCSAQLAHWYSLPLGSIAPAGVLPIELWFDPETGTYTLLNDKRENMPVEALWCGLEGRAYETRAPLVLDRGADAVPAPRTVVCSEKSDRLACT